LLREDRSGAPYTIPLFDPEALLIPVEFFLNGWVYVLTPTEIATLLVLLHAARREIVDEASIVHWPDGTRSSEPPIRLFRATRVQEYGLSQHAYGAHRELAEFGLIKMGRPRDEGRRGRASFLTHADAAYGRLARQPRGFWFYMCLPGLGASSLDVVSGSLAPDQPAPHLRRQDESTDFWVSNANAPDWAGVDWDIDESQRSLDLRETEDERFAAFMEAEADYPALVEAIRVEFAKGLVSGERNIQLAFDDLFAGETDPATGPGLDLGLDWPEGSFTEAEANSYYSAVEAYALADCSAQTIRDPQGSAEPAVPEFQATIDSSPAPRA